MDFIYYLPVFILGLCVGSFLNCLIYRMRKGEKPTGRSYCPKCGKKLKILELVPVFSFFALGGKCRGCGGKISWQYPLVETAAGVLFLFSALLLPYPFYYFIIMAILLLIFVYDFKYFLIPEIPLFLGVFIALFYNFFNPSVPFWGYLFSGAGAAIFFLALWGLSGGKWMGFGDAELSFFIGVILGFPKVLSGLFLGFLIGAITGIITIATGKAEIKSKIPFAPFLITGALISLFWGERIIQWYLNIL